MSQFLVEPSRRSQGIRYAVRDVLSIAEEARAGGLEILNLNIGDPLKFDHQTPAHMVEAVIKALRDGKNGYAPSPGTPESVEAIQGWARRKGIREIQDVFVGNGASEAIEIALASLLNVGDEVLLPNPGYPLYDALLSKFEAKAVHYTLDESNGWQPDAANIESVITDKTRVLVLINPNNPTGSLTSKERLTEIADVARRHNLVVFSDEIYDEIVFDGLQHTATAALCPDVPCITFGGLSKAYLACGWRIGWAVVSGRKSATSKWVDALQRTVRSRLCSSHPVQAAIPAALNGPQDHLVELKSKLEKRRDLTVDALNAMEGVSCVPPRGAFYAFPSVESSIPDVDLVGQLIRATGVVVVHGTGFGPELPKAHFRIVFAPPESILVPAYKKIGAFLSKHRNP